MLKYSATRIWYRLSLLDTIKKNLDIRDKMTEKTAPHEKQNKWLWMERGPTLVGHPELFLATMKRCKLLWCSHLTQHYTLRLFFRVHWKAVDIEVDRRRTGKHKWTGHFMQDLLTSAQKWLALSAAASIQVPSPYFLTSNSSGQTAGR